MTDRVGHRPAVQNGGDVCAVERVATAGGVHDLNLKRRLVLDPVGGIVGRKEAAVLAADEVVLRDEVVLELQGEGMHAAVTRRGVGLAREFAARRLLAFELVTGEGLLLYDQDGEPLQSLAEVLDL